MSYSELPADVLEAPAMLTEWVKRSLAIGKAKK